MGCELAGERFLQLGYLAAHPAVCHPGQDRGVMLLVHSTAGSAVNSQTWSAWSRSQQPSA
jgi:hypothetical protein